MTDETSQGEKRSILLPLIIFLSVAYVLLKISPIKIPFWILVVVAIAAVLLIVLPSKLRPLAPSATKTIEESLSSARFQELKSNIFSAIRIIVALIVLGWSLNCLGIL